MLRASVTDSFNPTSVAVTGGTIDNTIIGASTPTSGKFTTLITTVSSALKGLILGTGAAAGNIGEILTSTIAVGSPVTVNTGAAVNITSFSINPGNYLVWGMVDYNLTGVTATFFQSGVSIVSATLPTQPGAAGLGSDSLIDVPLLTTALTSVYGQQIMPVPLNISGGQTLYLVAKSTFSLGTMNAYGSLYALRIS